MTENDLTFIRGFVKQRSGLDLSPDKGYLVECRLGPVARQRGHASLSELVGALSRGADPALADLVVEAMTTNESSFFRDKAPFENFRSVMLPELMRARAAQRRVRIWCAAASTGQEPYSLAMILEEERARLAAWHVDILATDIAPSVAQRGQSGRYSQFEVQRGLPIQHLMKYFTQTDNGWQLNEPLRRMVRWKVFNLLDSYAELGRFDVIFCRNVLIYFDRATKTQVLDRMADALSPDGFLVLGSAETVVGLTGRFQPEPSGRGLYRPVAAGSGQPKLRLASV